MKDFSATAEIVKLDAEQQIAYGWGSVIEKNGQPVVDLQGDVMDLATLQKAVHQFISEARNSKVMHEGDVVAEVVESMVMSNDLQKALGIELGKVGWLVGVKVHDAGVWKRIKSGDLPMFSIGGEGERAAA